MLVEIQALVSRSGLAMPRRTAIGLDPGRVALLLAVLEKRMRVALHDQDVFLNVAGGLRVDEPATLRNSLPSISTTARSCAIVPPSRSLFADSASAAWPEPPSQYSHGP